MVLLIVIRDMPIDRRRPDRSDPQLALLGHRFARVRYPADQIAVGRVRQAWGVRRVRGMPGPKVRVVDGHDDRPVLLGHGGDRVRVVRVRQMFLGVEERGQNQRLPVAARRPHETSPPVSDRELMATAAAPPKIERWAGQAKARLKLQQSGPPLFSLTTFSLEPSLEKRVMDGFKGAVFLKEGTSFLFFSFPSFSFRYVFDQHTLYVYIYTYSPILDYTTIFLLRASFACRVISSITSSMGWPVSIVNRGGDDRLR